jgi:hypothetical protein
VFGIGLIVWFVWVGVLLLTEHAPGDQPSSAGIAS